MQTLYIEPEDRRRLNTHIRRSLLREALNRRLITPGQFSQLMELQRGR